MVMFCVHLSVLMVMMCLPVKITMSEMSFKKKQNKKITTVLDDFALLCRVNTVRLTISIFALSSSALKHDEGLSLSAVF